MEAAPAAEGEGKKGGAVLQGRYEMGRVLGHGNFGRVHVARDLRTGKSVAVKVVTKEKVVRAGMMEQIKREIGVREDVARHYFRQLISAVDFCHSRGVFHRDLKPENLLLDEAGNLKVVDFGLSALADHARADGLLHTLCGTPGYAAPEVLRDKGYDGAKADLWSCGVILYVLLAGSLPFPDDNIVTLYRKAQRGDYRCPTWLSTDARRLIPRLLDPNPSTRISVAQLVETPWFKKTSISRPVSIELPPADADPAPASCAAKEEAEKDEPETLNAFHLISLSEGFDLSPLFEGDSAKGRRDSGMLFATREPASGVISRLEEVAARGGGRMRVTKSGARGVRLEGAERGGTKGRLAVAADIFSVAPSVLVVDVKKDAGDTLEYRSFCSEELRPALKDIVWGAAAETPPTAAV
uniref:non-specific serine/threonine protein kinase n=2 Tax=Oryza punctata TaxID=4537 RepID=A0A0E0LVB3_ORYPU